MSSNILDAVVKLAAIKQLDKELIQEIILESITGTLSKKLLPENELEVFTDAESGSIKVRFLCQVVEIEENLGQISLADARADFDRSAARNLLTRDQALAEMQGTPFLEDRRTDLTATFARAERVSSDLALLRAATPLERLAMPQRLGDAETLAATWADFRPAVPVTVDGAITAGIGFVGGWGGVAGLLALLMWPFRRRRLA